MAFWITKSGTLGTPNTLTSTEWYRVEAQNPYSRSLTSLVLSTTPRTIAFTPANAGNLVGGVIQLTQNITHLDIDINDVTIKLQENVASVWTDRASVTLTRSQVMSGNIPQGSWYTPFEFTSPYAVTAVAGVWRLSISSPATTSTYWSLCTSDGTNAMYAVYSDFTGTPTSGTDFLYIAHYTNIDTNWTFKAVTATGFTTSGFSSVICRNLDATIANVAYLRLPNPASPITLTMDGEIQVSTHGGVQFGTEATPIDADKLNIWLADNTVGSGQTKCGFTGARGQIGGTESRWSLFHYGVEPTDKYALTTNTCAVGNGTVDVDNPSMFTVNDYITIGRRSTTKTNDTGLVKYKITNITSNTLTFTPTLASAPSIVGARIYKWMNATTRATGYGINVRRTETAGKAAYLYHTPYGTLNNFVMKGVFFQNAYMNGSNGLGCPDISANSSEYLFEGCVFNNNFYEDSNTLRYFVQMQGYCAPFYGLKFKNCVSSYLSSPTSSPVVGVFTTGASTVTSWYAGAYTIENWYLAHLPVNGVFNTTGVSTIPYYWDGIYVDSIGAGSSGIYCTGYNSLIKNIDVWGHNGDTNTGLVGSIYPFNLYNSVMENITVNFSNVAMQFGGVTTGNIYKNFTFGTTSANLTDIKFNYVGLAQGVFRTINGNPTFSTNINTLVAGSELGFQDVNATGVDYTKQPFGDIIRCGTGLADTKEHNGNQTLKFISKSGTNRTYWEQLVPTGDIQNKDMTVGVWVWIDNTAYDAGVYEMPRLTVSYDNDTATTYGEAIATFGAWQFIHASFSPTTTYGQIKVKLSTMTDASLANAPVYFGDMSVLYPAGHTISLGDMNLWADGLPVSPSISTTVSAQDVWAADPTTFGTGTVGEEVNKIKIDTAIIPALL